MRIQYVFILYECLGIRNTVYFMRILKYTSYTNVSGIRNTVYFMRIQYVIILYECLVIRNTVYLMRMLKYTSYTNVWVHEILYILCVYSSVHLIRMFGVYEILHISCVYIMYSSYTYDVSFGIQNAVY